MTKTDAAQLAATIIVPTHGNRAPVLRHSIPSILTQSETAIEIIVIGDGAAPETRELINRFAAQDPRIRFVDRPKHRSRGEPYRHDILRNARGRIVCYLCDRDLMLPNHVAHMSQLLTNADFAHSARVAISLDDQFSCMADLDLSQPSGRRLNSYAIFAEQGVPRFGIPLSFAAHTLAAYHRFGISWDETPNGFFTDGYMWRKFLVHPDCRARSDNTHPTILYFPRKPNHEWPAERRATELARWSEMITTPGWQDIFNQKWQDASQRLQRSSYRLKWRKRVYLETRVFLNHLRHR